MMGVGASTLLHLIAPFIYGWGMPMTLFIPIALLYLGFILGLRQGLSWLPYLVLAYLVLACMVIGGLGSLYEIYRVSPIADLFLVLIALADFIAAAAISLHLKAKRA